MRTIISMNEDWSFRKPGVDYFDSVNLPHTWNNEDGQDGDGQYLKGKATYQKEFEFHKEDNQCVFLEVCGAAMVADVTLNYIKVGHHEGGYSSFRVDLTDALQDGINMLMIEVDNSVPHVYPQMADFTFYGGLYRDVNLIVVEKEHFELLHHATPGIKVTPRVEGKKAQVEVVTWQTSGKVEICVNGETKCVDSIDGNATVHFEIDNVRLWDGKEDPYLYTASAKLIVEGEVVDEIQTHFGCRTFEINAEKGFLLNGREYPLCGVSRHQDREEIGNALTKQMHDEDFQLIYEMGANSIRLAHYQHDQYFYDLCDRYGIVVWAEIPYISAHMKDEEANQNTQEQMKDLIVQNYNHPSIVCWGLSNEITMQGNSDECYENHIQLNQLVHEMDPTRKTVMANVGLLSITDRLISLPDATAYNVYFGWYTGELKDNEVFFDKFHETNPTIPVGFTEYGCDTNPAFHSSNPTRGDYTEEYQCLYHEHILEMLEDRPWIWCSYAWNMFDFAADARNEGGNPGRNQKGLVSFDRKTKKDAYYLYQAYWTKKPFIHICGRRYEERNEYETTIRVYTNLDRISLIVDGTLVETRMVDKVTTFTIPLLGETHIECTGKDCRDQMVIRHVDTPNESYVLKGAGILNWFDADGLKEDYYSLKDSVAEIAQVPELQGLIDRTLNTEAEGDGKDLVQARLDRSHLLTLTDLTMEEFLDQSGNPISNNIKRHVNSMLQQIKKK